MWSWTGVPVPIGRRRERLLLAVLLLEAGKPVEVPRLIDLIWDDERLPHDPRATLHVHVSRLRRVLGSAGADRFGIALESVGTAYRLVPGTAEIDVEEFGDLVRRAGATDDPAERSALLTAALALWRGDPLAGLAPDALRARLCPELERLRQAALESRAAADLELGRHDSIIADLTRAAAAYPASERLTELLMVALFRAGRPRDSLDVYAAFAEHLADELGLDPGENLRRTRTAILRDDGRLRLSAPRSRTVPAPRHLLAPPTTLVGREADLARLLEAARRSSVVTVTGMAGVGKTALLLRAAHAVKDDYPDAQIYLDLRGFTPDMEPLTAESALERLLRLLGVPAAALPEGLDALTVAYQRAVADRRALLVLDNAASERQVEPLLPGTRAGLVLVASRLRLSGLLDAAPVPIQVLSPPDAVALLADLVGADAGAETLGELAADCGYLPLALRVVAARLRHRSVWSPAYLLGRLRDADGRLRELRAGDRSVSAAVQLSYDALPATHRRVFERLGTAPVRDTGVATVAALSGLLLPDAGQILDDLVDAHLVEEPAPDRYRLHDLVGLFARAVGVETLAAEDRAAAHARLLRHYAAGIGAANAHFGPHASAERLREAAAGAAAPVFHGPSDARAWLDAERESIVRSVLATGAGDEHATVAAAVAAGLPGYLENGSHNADGIRVFAHMARVAHDRDDRTGEIVALRNLGLFHSRRGHRREAMDSLRAALAICREDEPTPLTAGLLTTLGECCVADGEADTAATYLREALALYARFGQPMGEAHTLRALSTADWTLGRHAEALAEVRRAAELAAGHPVAEAHSVMMCGMYRRMGGDHRGALVDLRHAEAAFAEAGALAAHAYTLAEIGAAEATGGDLARAEATLRSALTLAHDSGDINSEFEALYQLGEVLRESGDLAGALHHAQAAVELADRINQPRDCVRACDGAARTLLAGGLLDKALGYWHRALDRHGDLRLPEVAEVRARLLAATA